jgi:hypothetical protein
MSEVYAKYYSFYAKSTGLLSPKSIFAGIENVAANTPPDHIAIEGQFDPRTQRIDVETKQPVPYRSPQPTPHHMWSDAEIAWVDEGARRMAQLQQQMAAIEARQPRALREATLFGHDGAMQALHALEAQIAPLRDEYSEIKKSRP